MTDGRTESDINFLSEKMKYKKLSNGFFLRLISGENVLEKLSEFCEKEKINSGSLSGIGALSKAEIGHFSVEKKEYETKTFEEELEVLAFEGNISLKEGKPFVHAHVTLGKKDFSLVGGHFVSGIVGATLELFLHNSEFVVARKKEESGLFLLDLQLI